MPKETTKYRGKVNIAIKKGRTTIKKSTHNAGLPDMAYLFSKAVTGTLDYNTDIPRVLDVGYVVPPTESPINEGDSGVWMSILTDVVPISGRQYKFDMDLENWVGVLTTTIYANDLNVPLLKNVKENLGSGNYILKIRMCSYNSRGRKYFAEIPVNYDFVEDLSSSTSAIITWYAELLYDENDASNTYSGNVEE